MLYTKSVFISAELSSKNKAENKERTAFLRATLKLDGYVFQEIIGVSRQSRTYKGSEEVSFMIEAKNSSVIDKLSKLAFGNYKQDSIGILSEDSSFILQYSSGKVEGLGYLQHVPSKRVEDLESYSVIGGYIYSTSI